LAVLLELCDELITLLHNIGVLLVLVIWSVGLDDTLSSHPVNGTWDAFSRDELSQITTRVSKM
jgi:hypothetical protein